VLIPRPETELLVDLCLTRLPAETSAEVLDLCTGSGCVAITLAAERPNIRVVATDVSAEALEVSTRNSERHGTTERLALLRGDLFAPVAGRRFDILCANPPYVATGEIAGLQREIREHEPKLALDGGADGLAAIRRIAAHAPAHLKPEGFLAVEIGETQGAATAELFRNAGLAGVEVHQDYARHDRVVSARAAAGAAP
jgi:release factor glutamine methyltransferase